MSDYISREEAINSICQYGTAQERIGRYAVTISELKQTVADTLSDLPSADVRENIHGEWEVYADCEGKTRTCTCNICGYKTGKYTWKNPNFCAECGADMRGDT